MWNPRRNATLTLLTHWIKQLPIMRFICWALNSLRSRYPEIPIDELGTSYSRYLNRDIPVQWVLPLIKINSQKCVDSNILSDAFIWGVAAPSLYVRHVGKNDPRMSCRWVQKCSRAMCTSPTISLAVHETFVPDQILLVSRAMIRSEEVRVNMTGRIERSMWIVSGYIFRKVAQ